MMTSNSTNQMRVSTPEVLWHGGGKNHIHSTAPNLLYHLIHGLVLMIGNENGKPDPVYSVDLHPTENVLSTSGVDANVPPKGSVRVSIPTVL
jgi:hypothetical protein